MIHEPSTLVTYSVIVPIGPRYADMHALYADYEKGLALLDGAAELIFVIDGPRPEVASQLASLSATRDNITVVTLSRYFGEATALMAGFERARGEIILTLPAYFQIQGQDIPRLTEGLDAADLTVGRRWPRRGGALEVLRRKMFHSLVARVTGLRLNDLGSGARAMRRRVLEEISLYGDQHRFLAVLADRQGFRVREVDVGQSDQDHFEGTYQPKEYAHRALDIFTIFFLVRFTKKPLRFFGMVGASTFGIGAALMTWLVVERLFLDVSLANRPALLLASLLVVLGLQLFAIGLLGELMIFTHAKDMKDYHVDKVIHFPRDEGQSTTEIEELRLEKRP